MSNKQKDISEKIDQEKVSNHIDEDTQNTDQEQKLLEEIEDLKNKLLRSHAELDNMRKRAERQIQEEKDYALTGFAKDLINVIDNLDRAVAHKPNQDTTSKEIALIIQGIEMIQKQLEEVLTKHGIKPIHTEPGNAFDHNIHQAISHVETSEQKSGTVFSVMQIGYKIKDRLLRPAIVTIAKPLKEANNG